MDFQGTIELVSTGASFIKYHAPADIWPNTGLAAIVAACGGLVMALWGARLLRVMYVVAFMTCGAYLGIKLARHLEVDDLIGLVAGAGLLGLTGHLFYRWWVGMTAGLCAVVLVALFAGPQALPEEIGRFHEFRDGVVNGDYSAVLQEPGMAEAVQEQGLVATLNDLKAYLWSQHTHEANRAVLILLAAWLFGLLMGVALPKFTSMVGTSVLGVTALAIGSGILLNQHWPEAWSIVASKGVWIMWLMVGFMVVALLYQARGGRPLLTAPETAPAA